MQISDTGRSHTPDFHAVLAREDWQNQTITTLTACQRIPFSPAGAMSLPPAITYLHPAAVNWTASGSSLTPAARLPSMRSG
ncbi:hypothetical protein RKK42_14885 [Klebsiella pneumoniae]|nr:hypothetical protein [Klebsiella pneumoniae]